MYGWVKCFENLKFLLSFDPKKKMGRVFVTHSAGNKIFLSVFQKFEQRFWYALEKIWKITRKNMFFGILYNKQFVWCVAKVWDWKMWGRFCWMPCSPRYQDTRVPKYGVFILLELTFWFGYFVSFDVKILLLHINKTQKNYLRVGQNVLKLDFLFRFVCFNFA